MIAILEKAIDLSYAPHQPLVRPEPVVCDSAPGHLHRIHACDATTLIYGVALPQRSVHERREHDILF